MSSLPILFRRVLEVRQYKNPEVEEPVDALCLSHGYWLVRINDHQHATVLPLDIRSGLGLVAIWVVMPCDQDKHLLQIMAIAHDILLHNTRSIMMC